MSDENGRKAFWHWYARETFFGRDAVFAAWQESRRVALEEAAQLIETKPRFENDRDGSMESDEASGWRPIDSAPKDGTNVLLVNRKVNMATGLWMNSNFGVGWYLRGGVWPDTFFNGHFGPTHWQPLPNPPEGNAP